MGKTVTVQSIQECVNSYLSMNVATVNLSKE